MSIKQKTFQNHTTWFKSSQKKEETNWKSAYEVAGIDLGDTSFKEENFKRIDQYWYKVYHVHKMVILAILSPIYYC